MASSVSGIYEIVHLASGRRYVGSAKDIRSRWRCHRSLLGRGQHHSFRLQRAWDKHGSAAFEFRLIEVCSVADLIPLEQSAIDRMTPAYNIAPRAGSCLGAKLSPEARAKISASKLGNQVWLGRKHSAETIQRMSLAHRGNTRTKGKSRSSDAVEKTAAAHRGRKRSEVTRQRISEALTGKKRAPRGAEYCRRISEALTGRVRSPEHCRKLSEAAKRRRLSPEHKAKIGEASRRAWARRK